MILAGGTGTRVGGNVPKQFVRVLGKPILAYTLEAFQSNANVNAIEVVCHKDWMGEAESIVDGYSIGKVRWMCSGGSTYQDSAMNGVLGLKGKLTDDDILVSAFGAAPMVAQADIDDSIRVCRLHGNGISAAPIDMCTCLMDDDESTVEGVIRETLKGFANPWAFTYGELLEAYETARATGLLDTLEPHTTSLYLALGKRLWFSQFTAPMVKITHPGDLDLFEGLLLLKKARFTAKGV